MNKENTAKLVKSYPKIFENVGGDRRYTCMAHGIECNDGWYDLINDLCRNLQEVMEMYGFPIVADQVKEKYGVLEFYYHIENREEAPKEMKELVQTLVSTAKELSATTCEKCGLKGRPTIRGFYHRTLCNDCDKGWKAYEF